MNKRKRLEEQGFFIFPGNPTHFSGSFRENIETLLKFGHLEALLGHGDQLQCHSFQFQLHQHSTKLLVLEEDVKEPDSQRCHYCHFAGWGHHIIRSKRFHFVLPPSAALQAISHHVARDWLKKDKSGSVKPSKTNCILMHGVMHSNGFGHLVEINNGFQGGSHFISGRQIMDLWDTICSALQVRKVSLIDIAMKGEMELRLVHGIAYSEPWFGRWGYKFGCGSYGATTQEVYRHSLQVIRDLPLCCLLSHHLISSIIIKYQSFSEQILSTLSDLFRFMIGLQCSSITSAKTRLAPKCAQHAMDYYCQEAMTKTPPCRWSGKRVAMAARVIVEKLKNSGLQWVTRQAIRDAARAYVGDTGLLDYVLKTLGDRVFAGYIVRRKVNPITRLLEYCVEDISRTRDQCENRFQARIMRDLLCLYRCILSTIPKEVKVVLNAKQLVKDFKGELRAKYLIVGDVKHHIEGEIREGDNVFSIVDCDTFAVKEFELESRTEDLVVEDETSNIKVEIHECNNEMSLAGCDMIMMEARSVLDAKCLVKDNEVELQIKDLVVGDEKGNIDEINIVNCGGCGVKDGERTICCNICEDWEHTRCVGIADEEEAPSVFICGRCENEMLTWQSLQVML
ncbi:PHD finger protein PERSISTENT TAPETAL CELL 1-like isoform X1 [Zingiber officinale]|uniref:PHD finger protein PERSISTENT TAPETAL CELL 1-like isoform X1 n=1 Tax=Zingiber officinale TaxID=94328 RepID=UPI001C4AC086|nr:PHD finger protein PERSISTENT TAPETAL CELL 1-like isoform X1 [Zingiber officinale]